MNSINALNFKSTNPRRNLPDSVRRKRTEVLFQNAFLKVWLDSVNEIGVGGSQFELSNCGIADYIWVNASKQIDAFEFKINNWKGGLIQAVRYRNYASRSFLVLPLNVAKRISKEEKTLKQFNIGLYGFDMKKKEIELLLSPSFETPLNISAYNKAMSILFRKRNFRQLCEFA